MDNNKLSKNVNYGVPFYGAAWVPISPSAAAESESPATSAVNRHVILAGCGGDARTGIENAVFLSTFDSESNSLSKQPVAKVVTGSDAPFRIAVHPGGEGIICSFPKSCRWFELDAVTSPDQHALSLKLSEKVFEQLEDVGLQLAMTFNNEGNLLATGGEDGKLRVFRWPSMETILDESNAHAEVNDLDFSPDGKFLISVGGGPGRVWNVSTSTSIAALPVERDEDFRCCRFSQTTDSDQVLYVTTKQGEEGGSIVKWNTTTWKRIGSPHVVGDRISALNVSPDGKLLAVGTNEGDISIISSASMREQMFVRKAHDIGPVTALAFSQDSRALISASCDHSARVTLIEDTEKYAFAGTSLWIILFVVLLAAAVYYAISNELLFP